MDAFLLKKTLSSQIDHLTPLVSALKAATSAHEKIDILSQDEEVLRFLEKPSLVRTFLSGLSPECELVIKAVIAIGQGQRVFFVPSHLKNSVERFRGLLEKLLPVEKFYSEMGGIVGYHWEILRLLEKRGEDDESFHVRYLRPEGMDISHPSLEVNRAIAWGISHLPSLVEIYPLGGAADRLRLRDEKTGVPLPAARLNFLGKSLLEGLIADLQAKEFLYYKLYDKKILTPVAIMTSLEKDNHSQILSICEEYDWFSRPKDSFRLFCQPLVPTIDKAGNWCLQGVLKPLLKPGGHGVIWKLAKDQGIFDWLLKQGKKKALIRQINNPIAGVDQGLFAFCGIGCSQDKQFGFASCPRHIKATEGINVLVEKARQGDCEYVISNVEYCDLKKFNIVDEPAEEGSSLSKYSANTNILFVDLKAVLNAIAECPLPGMLLNLKKTLYVDEWGLIREEEIGRLESTMQNIADVFVENLAPMSHPSEMEQLKTFLTYNRREKTISTTKREFVLGSSLLETPEGCFVDILKNARELLVEKCGMDVPEVNEGAAFFIEGPSFIFLYHPCLGPLYSLIGQKLRKGCLFKRAEMQLEIAEFDAENLSVDGSFLIKAESPMGHKDVHGILNYSHNGGKCTLRNVKVINKGIDFDSENVFWKNEIFRNESCEIRIYGDGEFYAEDVTFAHNVHIEVEEGTRVTAKLVEGNLKLITERIKQPTWSWKYSFDENFEVTIKK